MSGSYAKKPGVIRNSPLTSVGNGIRIEIQSHSKQTIPQRKIIQLLDSGAESEKRARPKQGFVELGMAMLLGVAVRPEKEKTESLDFPSSLSPRCASKRLDVLQCDRH